MHTLHNTIHYKMSLCQWPKPWFPLCKTPYLINIQFEWKCTTLSWPSLLTLCSASPTHVQYISRTRRCKCTTVNKHHAWREHTKKSSRMSSDRTNNHNHKLFEITNLNEHKQYTSVIKSMAVGEKSIHARLSHILKCGVKPNHSFMMIIAYVNS